MDTTTTQQQPDDGEGVQVSVADLIARYEAAIGEALSRAIRAEAALAAYQRYRTGEGQA